MLGACIDECAKLTLALFDSYFALAVMKDSIYW